MSKKPPLRLRIMVTVSPELDRLLDELAEVACVAKSSMCRQLLEDAKPQLRLLLKAARQARESSADALDTLAEVLEEAQSRTLSAQASVEEAKIRLRRASPSEVVANENGQG